MISKYNNFIEDRDLLSINETYVYIVDKLSSILTKLSQDKDSTISRIAAEILSLRGQNIDQDITLLNIDDAQPGFITFTSHKNIKNNFKDTGINLDTYFDNRFDPSHIQAVWDALRDPYDKIRKSRTPTRVGRLLNSLFPKRFTAKEVELFTNAFKAAQESMAEKISIVEGEDIKEWYHEDKYAKIIGSLGNSCMRRKKTVFNIYINNPEVCRMVIITEDNKLIGRALLWKIEGQEFEYFMDRQYVINDSIVNKFRKYADDNGFAYKTRNSHSSYKDVTYKGESKNMDLSIKLKKYEGTYDYIEYPYMDTFRRYDVKNGILYNDDKDDETVIGQYILDDTEGGYNEIEDTVYSEFYDEEVSRSSAVWSERYSSYLNRNNSVQVTQGSRVFRDWYPDDDDYICWDCKTGIPYHQDDCVFSDFYGDYIFGEDSVELVNSIGSNGNIDVTYIHKNDIDKTVKATDINSLWIKWIEDDVNGNVRDYCILKTILLKDYKGNYVTESLIIESYEVKSDEYGKIWLDTIDAEVLGLKISGEGRTEDIVEYYNDIYENTKLYNALLKGYEDKYNFNKKQLRLDIDDYSTRANIRRKESLIQAKMSIYDTKRYKIN